jgi:hypothetical protein
MKKIFVLLVLILLLVGCTPPPEPQSSVASQIPEEISLAISAGFVALFTAGSVYLFNKLGLDLKGFATPLGMAVGTWSVSELQNYINLVPETYDPWFDMLFRIILVVIGGGVGILSLLAHKGDGKKKDEPNELI